MVNRNLLEQLAAKVLEVDVDASEDEINEAYREKTSQWHPDVSDDPDATDKFTAASEAQDILLGDVDFSDPNSTRNAMNILTRIVDEDEVRGMRSETEKEVGYRSEAEARADPSEYSRQDFVGADPSEKREIMKEMALGVETMIIYRSVEGMYESGYGQEDFFEDINDYVGEASGDIIDFNDYYEATKDSLRDGVTRQLFVNSCEKVEENLQEEYGEGTNLREVARIVSYFMVQGGIRIGDIGRFVGTGPFGRDDRFTTSHPLGGHGSRRGRDSRFTRGSDRYERR